MSEEKRYHSGGVLKSRPQKLPEGVVGYTMSGRPVYDGDWFDMKMFGTRDVVIFHVGGTKS